MFTNLTGIIMANLTTGIYLRSKVRTCETYILLFSEIREGTDTLFTLSGTDQWFGAITEKVIAQQGAYGMPDAGWHYTKEEGTNVNFRTVAEVLEYHGLEYRE